MSAFFLNAQEKKRPLPEADDYFRKEEIIYYGKRYRIHNNYLTMGGGFLNSTIRSSSQSVLGVDFQFHVRRQHFQAGIMMSGNEFLGNNNAQGHFCYGYRVEKKSVNLTAFLGPCFYTGVTGVSGTPPEFYQGTGLYAAIQAVTKFTFDIGLGVEMFGEYSQKQGLFGFKIIAFFSGAYKGVKKNFNPNVRSENPR